MEIILLIIGMVLVGIIVGWLAGLIWKDDRKGDYTIAIVAAVITGLIDYYVIPSLGLSDTWKWLAVATEPACVALFVLWLVRKAKR